MPATMASSVPTPSTRNGPRPPMRPISQAKFCPTGGVNAKNAADYLALPNVVCVGGSWVAPADAVRAKDWELISALSLEAFALAPKKT